MSAISSFLSSTYANHTTGNIGITSTNNVYRLTKNMNLNGMTWSPADLDSGTFDGQNYTISNLTILSKALYLGFIKDNSGTIKNVSLDNVSITSLYTGDSDSFVGGICARNSGTISSCIVKGGTIKYNSTSNKNWEIGGICGKNLKSSTISQCINYASVLNGQHIGGIAGANDEGSISFCTNYGKISSNIITCIRCGGIAGFSSGKIISCRNNNDISGSSTNKDEAAVGGIVGYAISGIRQCENKGDVKAGIQIIDSNAKYYDISQGYAGGIVGITFADIDNCKNIGDVMAYSKINETISTNPTYHSMVRKGDWDGTNNLYHVEGGFHPYKDFNALSAIKTVGGQNWETWNSKKTYHFANGDWKTLDYPWPFLENINSNDVKGDTIKIDTRNSHAGTICGFINNQNSKVCIKECYNSGTSSSSKYHVEGAYTVFKDILFGEYYHKNKYWFGAYRYSIVLTHNFNVDMFEKNLLIGDFSSTKNIDLTYSYSATKYYINTVESKNYITINSSSNGFIKLDVPYRTRTSTGLVTYASVTPLIYGYEWILVNKESLYQLEKMNNLLTAKWENDEECRLLTYTSSFYNYMISYVDVENNYATKYYIGDVNFKFQIIYGNCNKTGHRNNSTPFYFIDGGTVYMAPMWFDCEARCVSNSTGKDFVNNRLEDDDDTQYPLITIKNIREGLYNYCPSNNSFNGGNYWFQDSQKNWQLKCFYWGQNTEDFDLN